MTTLFYIDGVEVSASKAKACFIEGLNRTVELGYALPTGLLDVPHAMACWTNKTKSEFARECIHSLSAILENGGLEVIIEND